MAEITRIARLLHHGFNGKPYYGPPVLSTLGGVTAELAARKLYPTGHSIWELVTHLTPELSHAKKVIEGTAGPGIEGQTTWPRIIDASDGAWVVAGD